MRQAQIVPWFTRRNSGISASARALPIQPYDLWGLISPQHFDDMPTRTKPLARRTLPRIANPALLE